MDANIRRVWPKPPVGHTYVRQSLKGGEYISTGYFPSKRVDRHGRGRTVQNCKAVTTLFFDCDLLPLFDAARQAHSAEVNFNGGCRLRALGFGYSGRNAPVRKDTGPQVRFPQGRKGFPVQHGWRGDNDRHVPRVAWRFGVLASGHTRQARPNIMRSVKGGRDVQGRLEGPPHFKGKPVGFIYDRRGYLLKRNHFPGHVFRNRVVDMEAPTGIYQQGWWFTNDAGNARYYFVAQ